MRVATLRCRVRHCGAKVRVEMDEAHHETFRAAIADGVANGDWDLYWAVVFENDARCWQHENLVVDDNGFVQVRA